jgi:heat shock protein HslJ
MPNAALTLTAFVLSIVAMTQATPTPADQAAIPPVIWELTELAPTGAAAIEIEDSSRYTVQFLPDGEVVVRADCNQGSGTFSISKEEVPLSIGPIASTLMLCPGDSHDADFLALLVSTTQAEFTENSSLVLTGDDGRLTLRPSLIGVVWEWQVFRGGDDSVLRPDHPERYTLEFLPNGKLAIQAGCNRATGTYTTDDPRLDLEVGGVTRATCPEGSLMEQYLRDLSDVRSFVMREGRLYLALRIDAGISEFRPRPVEAPAATPTAP